VKAILDRMQGQTGTNEPQLSVNHHVLYSYD